jgi:hypothetical protein
MIGGGVIEAAARSNGGSRISTVVAWIWRKGGRPMQKRGRWSGTRLLAQGSFGAATCCLGSSTRLPAQGSSGGVTCPHGSGSHLPTHGNSGGTTCRLGSSTRLPAQGSSGGATYPHGSGSHILTQGSSRGVGGVLITSVAIVI